MRFKNTANRKGTKENSEKEKGEHTMARVLISMPERFLDEIDEVAENENRTRSELIREALRTYMTRSRVRLTSKAITDAATLESLLD